MLQPQPSTERAIWPRPKWFGRSLEWTLGFYGDVEDGAPTKVNRHAVQQMLALEDLYYLLVYVCGRVDMLHPWIFERTREVQLAPDGYLDLWSRDHYKSTIITFGMTLLDILRDPEITVAILSHTRPIAKAFLRQIKREMEGNETLKALFPDVLWAEPHKDAPMWSEDGGIIVKRRGNPKEATLEAWGLVDGQPTSKHFALLNYDDVVTLESVTTNEMIQKTVTAWEMSTNLGTQDSRRRYTGTRYHLNDPYQEMMDRGIVTARIYPATDDGTEKGKPVLFTPAVWAEKLKTQRTTLAAQLLQNPLAAGTATFQAGWLKGYQLRPLSLNIYILGDPSGGRDKSADETAIAVIGISSSGSRYLLDGMCHRMSLSERWTALRLLWAKWHKAPGVLVCRVGWEHYGLQADAEYFRERMAMEKGKDAATFAIEDVNWPREGPHSKDERIARIEPYFMNGNFFVPTLLDKGLAPAFMRPVDIADTESAEYKRAAQLEAANVNGWKYATWFIDKGRVAYRGLAGDTKTVLQAETEGRGHLVIKPLRRLDEDRQPYDVTEKFFRQYVTHPVGKLKDFLDAMSRVEDMQPAPAMINSGEMPRTYADS